MRLHFFLMGVFGVGLILNGCKSNEKPHERVLHLVTSERALSLDPAKFEDVYSAREIGKVYESPLQFHYLKRPYELTPNLLAAMPEISADGKRYILHLKRGVSFADDPCFQKSRGLGRELVADDLVYSLKRLADPQVASPFWRAFDGRVSGLNAWRALAAKRGSADYSLAVGGLKVKDSYTVEIELTRPFKQFPFLLAMPSTSVVAREAVEYYGARFFQHPVGTGPFRLNLEISNLSERLVWVRNQSYRDEFYPGEGEPGDQADGLLVDRGKKLPLADRIEVRILTDSHEHWKKFEAGELDSVEIPRTVPPGVLTPTKELEPKWRDKGFVLRKGIGIDVNYVGLNLSSVPFKDNPSLRQALSLTIDTDSLIDRVYGGRAISAISPVPPGISGFDPHLTNSYRRLDLARAKDLLAKAGYPGGRGLPPLSYIGYRSGLSVEIPSRGLEDPLAEYLKRSFDQIGIKLKVTILDWKDFFTAIRSQKSGLWSLGFTYEYPDAMNVFQLFYGKNIASGANESAYSNPKYDQLYERLEVENDQNERGKISQEMLKILIEDCPWIWTVHQVHFRMAGPRLGNMKLNAFDYGFAKYLSVRD